MSTRDTILQTIKAHPKANVDALAEAASVSPVTVRHHLNALQAAGLIRAERLAAIGRMAAHVTHEVRNPLSSIGLNVDMLGDEFMETVQNGDPISIHEDGTVEVG